jgi:hypothetical protein
MLVVFGICGGGYLVWRSIYFGHMLPGPYLKKGGLHLHFDGLSNALTNAARLLLPLSALVLVGLSPKVSKRVAAAHLVPLVGFVAIWVLLSPEMNYQGRFQYAIMPLAMISWPMLVRPRVLRPAAIGALALALCAYQYRRFGADHYHLDGRSAVGFALRDVPGHCMAVTEAGLLPYRSHWCAIDTWGLNDDEIRREGVTDAYLDRFAPAIVMIHPDDRVQAWTVMVDRLRRYVSARPYVLAAEYSVGTDDVHLYYVRKDVPDAARIVALVRGVPYLWHDTDAYATNAAPEPDLGGSGTISR